MSAAESMLEAQTLALLRRLARERDARCRRIGDEAAAQAAGILRKAREEGKARVHQAVLELRREQERALARRRAALDTAARQRRQAALGVWLDQAWLALPAALQARWDDDACRAQWAKTALYIASRDLLGQDPLRVEADPRWLADLSPLVAGGGPDGRAATVVPEPGFGAGLRIRAGNACVDATVPGLLAARERIAADLLASVGRRAVSSSTEDAA